MESESPAIRTASLHNEWRMKNMTIIDISEFRAGPPFDDMDSEDYTPIDSVVGLKLEISDIRPFENDKGEGIYIRAAAVGFRDGRDFYICTHSIGICSILNDDAIKEALIAGEHIGATIVKRKSKTSDRMVYALE